VLDWNEDSSIRTSDPGLNIDTQSSDPRITCSNLSERYNYAVKPLPLRINYSNELFDISTP